MKHLFIARHGEYGDDDRIDENGIKQIDILGQEIKRIVDESSTYIITSVIARALDSSRILQAKLKSPLEEVPYISTIEDNGPTDIYEFAEDNNRRMMKIILEKGNKADALIILTHYEITEAFQEYFLLTKFGQKQRITGIEKRQAVHFNLEERTYQIIPR